MLQTSGVPNMFQLYSRNLSGSAAVAFYKSDYDTHTGQYDHYNLVWTHSAPPFPDYPKGGVGGLQQPSQSEGQPLTVLCSTQGYYSKRAGTYVMVFNQGTVTLFKHVNQRRGARSRTTFRNQAVFNKLLVINYSFSAFFTANFLYGR